MSEAGSITATCGHVISGEWFNDKRSAIIRRSENREGRRALSYEVVCEACRERLRKGGELLKNENHAIKWLRAKQYPIARQGT